MAAFQRRTRQSRGTRGDSASTTTPSQRPGTRRHPASPAPRTRATPHPLRRLLETGGPLGTAAAKLLLSGWRPLLLSWLSILTVAALGGATLQYLGPLPEHPAQGETPPEPRRPPEPIEAELPATAPFPAPSRERSSGEQAPLPGQPPQEVQAGVDAAQENAGAGSAGRANEPNDGRVLVVLHPPKSASGRVAAQQLATQAGLAGDKIATEPLADTPPRAIIRFYSAGDHALARRLGRELTQMNYPWQIENLSGRPSPSGNQAIEVWLPER